MDYGPSTIDYHYYHTDHLGSSNIITDETGTKTNLYEYTPYGETWRSEGSTEITHKFTGKELDNTGLYFYGARYYDPVIGRFITADTIVPNPYNPQDFNRYSYCNNNPINYTDPTGHKKLKDYFRNAIDIVISVVVTVVINVAGFTTMTATGGNVGFFGYYDHGRREFEIAGWVNTPYGPFIYEAGRHDGEWHVMGMGLGKFGQGGDNRNQPTSPSSASPPVGNLDNKLNEQSDYIDFNNTNTIRPWLRYGANLANPYILTTAQGVSAVTPTPIDDAVIFALAVAVSIYSTVSQARGYGKEGSPERPLPLKGAPGPDYWKTPQGENQPPRPDRKGWWIIGKILESISEMVDHFIQ